MIFAIIFIIAVVLVGVVLVMLLAEADKRKRGE